MKAICQAHCRTYEAASLVHNEWLTIILDFAKVLCKVCFCLWHEQTKFWFLAFDDQSTEALEDIIVPLGAFTNFFHDLYLFLEASLFVDGKIFPSNHLGCRVGPFQFSVLGEMVFSDMNLKNTSIGTAAERRFAQPRLTPTIAGLEYVIFWESNDDSTKVLLAPEDLIDVSASFTEQPNQILFAYRQIDL
ncbi:hypothetical protein HG530_004051 [Fusarium avenaceum]|nr:hypothetical protein HG530_004051 [Fusarium avenaceum]